MAETLTALVAGVLALGRLWDEATQPLVGRHFDWLDWAANLTGILAAIAAVHAYALIRFLRPRPATTR